MEENNQENLESLKILHDFAWQKYHKQHQYFESLDSKSSSLVTFIGILFTIISGFVYHIFTQESDMLIHNFNLLETAFKIILLLLVISISVAFYISLSSLAIKKIVDPSKISKVRDFLKDAETKEKRIERKLYIGIINNLSNSEESVRSINLNKSHKIKVLSIWLRATLFLVLINLILYAIIILNKVEVKNV